jgi:hypothetical protein
MALHIKKFIAAFSLCAAAPAFAVELPLEGGHVFGSPGETVLLDFTYDYGSGLSIAVEDLALLFPSPALSFNVGLSTVGAVGEAPQSLSDYIFALQAFALPHFGGVVPNAGNPGEFRMSYFTADLAGHDRIGPVQFHAAFDIAADAAPGDYQVSLSGTLYDREENEFMPTAFGVVSAVPEPAMALLLLPGLALVGWQVKRRRQA